MPSLAQRTANVHEFAAKPIRFIVPQATGDSKGTPPAIVNRVSNDIGVILKLPETQMRFTAEGAETEFKPAGEVDRIIKAEIAKWTRVARETRMPATNNYTVNDNRFMLFRHRKT